MSRITLAARRVRQTLVDFDNGTAVLTAIARHKPELVFEVDDDLTVICPNVAGARVPVYEVFAEDAYRLDWFTGDLPADVSAVDIGGHIGCFSMAFARLHPQGRVQTFEASPTTYGFLSRNITGNGFAERVTVNNTAVSSKVGTLQFADNAGGSGLNGITAPAGSTVIEIPCTTVAAAFAQAGDRVDVVKIDTEGAEYDIVLGSEPADWAGVQRVVMEYHPVDGHSWEELEEFFAKAGLTVVRQEPLTPRLGTVWLSRTALPL
ncbi:FkbM family methyltransferase [Aeromicrobium sp. Root236]|uniref:FkbM family methyltransferase n=1 Tax=Aeromicrobium sp. Root236 TaxID=1736498 RepID=UPI0009EA4585|nr:FkbM family methyltransferase [Aeromicrobium sp. Root236]